MKYFYIGPIVSCMMFLSSTSLLHCADRETQIEEWQSSLMHVRNHKDINDWISEVNEQIQKETLKFSGRESFEEALSSFTEKDPQEVVIFLTKLNYEVQIDFDRLKISKLLEHQVSYSIKKLGIIERFIDMWPNQQSWTQAILGQLFFPKTIEQCSAAPSDLYPYSATRSGLVASAFNGNILAYQHLEKYVEGTNTSRKKRKKETYLDSFGQLAHDRVAAAEEALGDQHLVHETLLRKIRSERIDSVIEKVKKAESIEDIDPRVLFEVAETLNDESLFTKAKDQGLLAAKYQCLITDTCIAAPEKFEQLISIAKTGYPRAYLEAARLLRVGGKSVSDMAVSLDEPPTSDKLLEKALNSGYMIATNYISTSRSSKKKATLSDLRLDSEKILESKKFIEILSHPATEARKKTKTGKARKKIETPMSLKKRT